MLKQRLLLACVVFILAAMPLLSAIKASAVTDEPGFGFTIGLDVDLPMTADDFEQSLDTFKNDVDIMVENNQEWVRFGIPAWVVAWYDGDMNFRHGTTDDAAEIETITYYNRAIDYIKQHDLKLYLVLTDGPSQGSEFTHAEYVEHMQDYWPYIAANIGDKADVIQIYNEAQGYHYRFYQEVPEAELEDYWAEMSDMLGMAASIFKTSNPDVLMTTNGAGYPVWYYTEIEWLAFMDAVQSNIDVISLDLYPEYQTEIPYLATSVENAIERYDKPVIISETGRHGFENPPEESRSYAGQEENIVKYIDTLRATDAMAVIVYELRDSGNDPNDGEANFGILKNNGDKKPSFDGIMLAMQPTSADGDNGSNGADPQAGSGADIVIPKVPDTGVAKPRLETIANLH